MKVYAVIVIDKGLLADIELRRDEKKAKRIFELACLEYGLDPADPHTESTDIYWREVNLR